MATRVRPNAVSVTAQTIAAVSPATPADEEEAIRRALSHLEYLYDRGWVVIEAIPYFRRAILNLILAFIAGGILMHLLG